MLLRLLLISLSLWTLPALATDDSVPQNQESPQMQLAQRYIHALTSRDFRQLHRLLHRDSEYEDVMADKSLDGRQEIINFLRRVHKYTEEYQFIPDHTFYKGDRVVLIGNYYYQAKGNLFGLPDELITVTLPGITILEVDVDKQRIDRHEDTLDYETMKAQLKFYHYEPAPPGIDR